MWWLNFVVVAKALSPHVSVNAREVVSLHRDPDVLLLHDVLTAGECEELIETALSQGLERSPVAYAGWTKDVAELGRLWASGPGIWLGLCAVLVAFNVFGMQDKPHLAAVAAGTWTATTAAATAAAGAFAQHRAQGLIQLRTSSSVALQSGPSPPELKIMRRLAACLPTSTPAQFEALTVIRYEPGQSLAPHFDANRVPEEDLRRGGQTLATLLVYLTDHLSGGGETRFNRLDLDVSPNRGQACLFFPADAEGTFDPRLEHEGRPLLGSDDKWIARVWVHASRVECGGLPPATLAALGGGS
ncbi:hypothetical protein CTAYLR_006368 [Chrysophaeum taylorii]|uniref:Fe2OG dioxygenase domain-containing protein n=1 Tax=Chrysophaeum taylorii TaxID=2483200 RepID=A0AAD7XFC6_9STRA|nr:hypothetical protein CTAYLR_006368 [Chrysophaeum taylorii]